MAACACARVPSKIRSNWINRLAERGSVTLYLTTILSIKPNQNHPYFTPVIALSLSPFAIVASAIVVSAVVVFAIVGTSTPVIALSLPPFVIVASTIVVSAVVVSAIVGTSVLALLTVISGIFQVWQNKHKQNLLRIENLQMAFQLQHQELTR